MTWAVIAFYAVFTPLLVVGLYWIAGRPHAHEVVDLKAPVTVHHISTSDDDIVGMV